MGHNKEERARQFLADQILALSADIGRLVVNRTNVREHFGMPHNPARDVEDMAAMMGVDIAKMLSSGVLCMNFSVKGGDNDAN